MIKYKLVKEFYQSESEIYLKHRLEDAGNKKPYEIQCINCNHSLIISTDGMIWDTFSRFDIRDENGEKWNLNPISKIEKCSFCKNNYLITIGYFEPNNGRDVFTLESIWVVTEIFE
jgi:hypothetical protein